MTDPELVAGLKANEDMAYREVVAHYGDALYGYIFRITGDPHMSEDVLSDTYLRMIEHIDTYTHRGPAFKAWLYKIAHNSALNALRRNRRSVATLDDNYAAPGSDPAHTVAAQLDAAELRTAVLELTEDQQQVVLLRFIAGYTPGEVAAAINKNENAVKQLQFRALRSLGRILERK